MLLLRTCFLCLIVILFLLHPLLLLTFAFWFLLFSLCKDRFSGIWKDLIDDVMCRDIGGTFKSSKMALDETRRIRKITLELSQTSSYVLHEGLCGIEKTLGLKFWWHGTLEFSLIQQHSPTQDRCCAEGLGKVEPCVSWDLQSDQVPYYSGVLCLRVGLDF